MPPGQDPQNNCSMDSSLLTVRKTHLSYTKLGLDASSPSKEAAVRSGPETFRRKIRGTDQPLMVQIATRLSGLSLLSGAGKQIVAIEWAMGAPDNFLEIVGFDNWTQHTIQQHETIVGSENVVSIEAIQVSKSPGSWETRFIVIPVCEEDTPVQRFTANDFIDLDAFLTTLKVRLPNLYGSLQRALKHCEPTETATRIVVAGTLNWHLSRLRLWLHELPEIRAEEDLKRLRADAEFSVPVGVEVHNRRVLELIGGIGTVFQMASKDRPSRKGTYKLAAREYFKRLLGIQPGDPRLGLSLESLAKASYYKVRRDYRELCTRLAARHPAGRFLRRPATTPTRPLSREKCDECDTSRSPAMIGVRNLTRHQVSGSARFEILEARPGI